MNRLGRGYSFEALRAKVLFAEGAFKTEMKRPKFKRRRLEPELEGAVYYKMFTRAPADTAEESTQEVKNYGIDISTLTDMIERDLI